MQFGLVISKSGRLTAIGKMLPIVDTDAYHFKRKRRGELATFRLMPLLRKVADFKPRSSVVSAQQSKECQPS